uniref:Uncharacterized protein n=1 Tax=Parascaris univalens TaxID=6257 RepID=A0A915ACU0_PARUN
MQISLFLPPFFHLLYYLLLQPAYYTADLISKSHCYSALIARCGTAITTMRLLGLIYFLWSLAP